MTHDPSQSPWYKQIWAWFIIAILAFAVFIGIGLLLVATMNPDSLVRDNYYSEGKAINMTLDRDHHARDMAIAASFAVDSVTGDISLQLEGALPALPRSLTLDLISPTHASRDRTVTLRQISGNTYTGQLEKQIEGRRYIELSDPDKPGEGGWRLTGELQLGSDQRYQLSAH
ncbi:MAG: FixH family protein [Pseudomonadota bacterium]|nr:FixH family protein [Pseudomonadota bacterium]